MSHKFVRAQKTLRVVSNTLLPWYYRICAFDLSNPRMACKPIIKIDCCTL